MNDKIDIDMAEDEDLARAKVWWKENGSSIIGGIVIGTAMVVGYNFWQKYEEDKSNETAQLYESFSSTPESEEALNTLVEASSNSSYALLAQLSAAKVAMDESSFDRAEQLLNNVIAANDDGLSPVAALRLATVFLAQKMPDNAIELMDKYSTLEVPLMQARILEIKADALVQKDSNEEAKTLYEASILAYTEAGTSSEFAQLKLDNL